MGQKKIMIAFTLVFIGIITFSITETVKGAEKRNERMGDNYLAQVEREYRKELKTILEEEGYSNAGITMTKIRQQDGELEYTIKINHKKLSKSTDSEKENIRSGKRIDIKNKIKEIDFQENVVEYQFL